MIFHTEEVWEDTSKTLNGLKNSFLSNNFVRSVVFSILDDHSMRIIDQESVLFDETPIKIGMVMWGEIALNNCEIA